MKRAREDEPESKEVGGSGDAPAVVAVDDEEKEAPAADLQNPHAGRQVIVVPDDEYDGLDPNSIEYLMEEMEKEAVPLKEEASDDGTEVLTCSV